mgnify:CR=1 FL=1
MSDLPAPLTPADCDLRDFAFMPLEVRRLLTSETWVLGTAEEKVAALCLWCEAWHQVPAASLPENERMLAHLSGAGGGWRKVREHALRGWIKCSDGRLYHPVVAEKALESWAKKEAQRERSRRANAARWGARNPPRDVSGGVEADREDAPSSVAGDPHAIPGASRKDASRIPQGLPATSHNDPKGQGQGEGEGLYNNTPSESGRAGRGTRLPDDFVMPEDWKPYAAGKGHPPAVIEREAEKFTLHWQTKTGKDATKIDWRKAWQKWVLGIPPERGGGHQQNLGGSGFTPISGPC